jgi:hypothetical protein
MMVPGGAEWKLVVWPARRPDQAPVPEDAMDWCQWECELTEGLAWKQ